MSKAIRLLTICVIATVLLAAAAAGASADTEGQTVTAEPKVSAEPSSDGETGAEADPMAPVDTPASAPGGTVYAVGNSESIALTVVDYTADGADAGVRFNGQSRYYYGAQITGADYGARIDGAAVGYFGSSGGSIPLYDGRGVVSGIVWGGCRSTAVECGVGFLLDGGAGTILVEDGASFTCREAVVRCSAGSGSFRFHNTRLSSGTGVLFQMEPEAGDVSAVFENGSYSGDFINGSASLLTVTVGRGALLSGDTMQSGGPIEMAIADGAVWVVEECSGLTALTVADGGTVYGDLLETGGTLILFPSDQVLEPGTYEAGSLTEELFTEQDPALPAEEASGTDAEEAPEAEQDADRARKLFPLLPSSTDSAVDAPEESDPAPEMEDPSLPEDAPAGDAALDEANGYDKRLFPLVPTVIEPAADTEAAPAPQAEASDQPREASDTSAAGISFPILPGISQATMSRSLLLGAGMAGPSALGTSVGMFSPSVEFAARLAARTAGQPPAASLLKTGAKTHSFLPQALDNRTIILYNPYCCSAA